MTRRRTIARITSRTRSLALLPPMLVIALLAVLAALSVAPTVASPLLEPPLENLNNGGASSTLLVPTSRSAPAASASDGSAGVFNNGLPATTTTPLLTANPSSSVTTTAPPNSTVTGTANVTSTSSSSSTSTSATSPSQTSGPPVMPANILTNFSDGRRTIDFLNPLEDGGFMTTILPMPNAPNLPYGEPINAIISGRSSRSVVNVEGFLRWATSVNFGVSCLGQVNGSAQLANLGDGRGNVTQGNDGSGDNGVLRWNYGDAYLGTCKESIIGGNHFRWYPQAKSGAYFLAASNELPAQLGHMVALNGYNTGRDELVANATNPNGTEWAGYRFNATVDWIPAGVLLNATSEGINHPSVALPGQPSQDGRVALLTITELATPDTKSAGATTLARFSSLLGLAPTLLAVAALTLAL